MFRKSLILELYHHEMNQMFSLCCPDLFAFSQKKKKSKVLDAVYPIEPVRRPLTRADNLTVLPFLCPANNQIKGEDPAAARLPAEHQKLLFCTEKIHHVHTKTQMF